MTRQLCLITENHEITPNHLTRCPGGVCTAECDVDGHRLVPGPDQNVFNIAHQVKKHHDRDGSRGAVFGSYFCGARSDRDDYTFAESVFTPWCAVAGVGGVSRRAAFAFKGRFRRDLVGSPRAQWYAHHG